MAKKSQTTQRQAPAKADDLGKQIRHLDGCPAERLERFPASAPDGRSITVDRCVDCGEASYEND